jgi:hypothetical protein
MFGHARSLPIALLTISDHFNFSFSTNFQDKCKEVSMHDKVECQKGVRKKGVSRWRWAGTFTTITLPTKEQLLVSMDNRLVEVHAEFGRDGYITWTTQIRITSDITP